MIVVKVGGSLFDHPRLGSGLRAYLNSLHPSEVLLVPGGGALADAVRELDRVHSLGEEASHWLAVRAMDVMGEALARIIDPSPTPPPRGEGLSSPSPLGGGGRGWGRARILDCLTFLRDDDSRPGALPHTWAVTSDSIAARAAIVREAERLVLLKSVDVPQRTSWEEAAARGWVDAYFARLAAGARFGVELVNMRRAMDSLRV